MAKQKLEGKKFTFAAFGGFLGEKILDKLDYNSQHANEKQKVLLERLMEQNKDTEYGKKYRFADVHSLEDYRRLVPLSTYKDYEDACHRMAEKGEKNLITSKKYRRFTHTTGTTGKSKIIPLSLWSEWILQIFNFCAPIACAKRYYRDKGQYMPPQCGLLMAEVISEKLPCGATLSCLSAIPLLNLKPLVTKFATSPEEVLFPDKDLQADMQYLKLRFALENRDVSYLGAVFITGLESLFAYMENHWKMFCDDIEKGILNPNVEIPDDLREKLNKKIKPNPERAEELRAEFAKGFDAQPIIPRIWPKCGWLYGMGTGARSFYAKRLRRYVGEEMPMHYLGYSATEAVMAVPIKLDSYEYVLLPQNAFFEFRDVDCDDYDHLLTIDQLEVGKEYEVIITNMSGFYRYMIKDVVKVTGYHYEAPKVTFSYRLNQVADISGEKITLTSFDEMIEAMCNELNVSFTGYSIYTDTTTSPGHFVILIENEDDVPVTEIPKYLETFERILVDVNSEVEPNWKNGSLGRCEVKFLEKGTYDGWREHLKADGVNLNQVKHVKVIDSDAKRDYFMSRTVK